MSNSSAPLTFKVGLISSPEMNILNKDNVRKTGLSYWLASPYYFGNYGNAFGRYIASDGYVHLNSVANAFGVRPAVSLATGTLYTSGDGSMASPYIVE